VVNKILPVIQECLCLTCLRVSAPYQSVWSVEVYCRLCFKVVVPIHKVGWVRLSLSSESVSIDVHALVK
jgi:hypothetical protein